MAEGNMPDISYRIVTQAELGGLQAHTAAAKADTVANEEQAASLLKLNAASQTSSQPETHSYNYKIDNAAGYKAALAEEQVQVAAMESEYEALGYNLENTIVKYKALQLALASYTGEQAVSISSSQAYTITTEAELLKAEQLRNKYVELAMSKRLLGIEDEALTAKIAVLDAALSTKSALTVAETMEAKALAAAKTEQTEAEEASAAAVLEEAGAHKINTTAMREAMVISRELMSGNISRLPGSAGLLAANMGFASAMPAILGVSVALMAGHELWKTYRKGVQDTKDELVEFKREAEHAAFALDMAATKARDSAAKFYDELDRIVTKAQSITEAMQQLNKAQEEAAHLDEAIAKTRETAALANAKEIKDPVARAQAEYAAKNEEIRRGEEEADKAGRLKFKNAEDGAKAAGAAMEAQIAQADKLSEAMQKAEATLGKAKSDKSEQDKALAQFRKLGLNEEQIEAIMSGKSFQELTGLSEKDARMLVNPGAVAPNAPINFGTFASEKYNRFANEFNQFSGALGGQAPKEQDARVEKAQHDFDTIQAAYNDAASKAKSLGEEFNKLESSLKSLGEELNAQSALRNQNGRDAQIKNLEELRTSYETLLKNLEDKFKDKQAPQSVLDKDAELRHAISGLTAAMNQLAGMPGAGSTAFQGFSHGHALGPGGVVPQFDFSEFDNVVSKMRDAFQKQLDDALRRVSKTFDHQASQIASATAS